MSLVIHNILSDSVHPVNALYLNLRWGQTGIAISKQHCTAKSPVNWVNISLAYNALCKLFSLKNIHIMAKHKLRKAAWTVH